jgi:hypothetical protein
MSIARITHASGFTGNPPPEALQAVEALRATDGCEHMYQFRNSQNGEGVTVTIWRDEAALDAASEKYEAARKLVTEHGLSIDSMKVYDVVAER